MSTRDAIRAYHRDHEGSPEELAEGYLATVRKRDLLPLLVEEFKWLIRNDVRLEELALVRSQPRRSSDLVPLLDLPYRVGDGMVRRFGAMTIEEHRARAAMLRSQAAGINRAADLHDQAAAQLSAHGAKCLDELPAVAAELVA